MSLQRLSLRVRLMIIGVTGVAVALLAGGLALFGALTVAIGRTLDNESLALADQVAAMVAENRLPQPIPVSGAQLVQVVDDHDRVVSASLTADRLVPLVRGDELATVRAGTPVEVPGARAGLAGPLRVNAARAGPGGRSTVIVARPVADVQATRQALRNVLLVTFPLLLAVLAGIAWWVIGWTLRPVEALRTGAERISGGTEQERLPIPVAADEIRALAITLNGMLDRLAAARQRQRSFVADAAHELRSPLASMRTQLEVAQRLGEAGDLPEDLLTDLDRLTGLVDDLLLLARLDADRRPPAAPTRVEVRSVLCDVARSAERLAGRGSTVTVRVDGGPGIVVRADSDELTRAITNLVFNAARHATSAVRLGVSADPPLVVITVDDDGPGIPAAERERVFDRFTRLDDARDRDVGGAGLGLAIARELLGRAGGTVRFDEAPAGWSLRAVITLPMPELDAGS